MQVWQKYFFKRWLKIAGYISILGVMSLIYMFLRKEAMTTKQMESILIVVSTGLCFLLGLLQVTLDYPLVLQVKAKRQCYLRHMGVGMIVGCLVVLILEKIIFGLLEGSGFSGLIWTQCIYRYNTLLMMTLLGAMIAGVFYRFTPMISTCLLGSFIAVGVASFSWGVLSDHVVIGVICNFYIMLLQGLTSIFGIFIYNVILVFLTYCLLYRAPIEAYKCDLV